MSLSEIPQVLLAALVGLLSSTALLLTLFVGFCFLAGLTKLRARGRDSMVVRNLGERMNGTVTYISPHAPRGPADQLRTPELLEQSAQNR